MKVQLSMLTTLACGLWLAIPLTAATPAAKTNKNKKTAAMAVRSVWAPETLGGKIAIVDPDRNLVVVEMPDGVPFDMVVTAKTKIDLGDRRVGLRALTGDTNKTVSVKFVPERRGDVAQSIRIGG